MKLRIAAILLSVGTALLLGFFPSEKWMLEAFYHTGYIFVFTAFFLWSYSLVKYLHRIDNLKTHLIIFMLCIICVSIIFIISPPRFKILNDEAQLIGVSHSMYYHKTIHVKKEGLFDRENLPDKPIIDKRPLLYPFLVSLVHSITGYSGKNGFVVNYISALLLLFLFQHLITTYYGRQYGLFSIPLFLSNPAFASWITSSGFETANALFLVFAFYAFGNLLKHRDIGHLNILLLALILLAQTRYEAILAAFILFCAALPIVFRSRIMEKANWLTIGSPLLILPVIWQRILFKDPSKAEIAYELEGSTGFFSIDYFLVNFPNNIYAMLGLDPDFGFNFPMSLLSLLGLYYALKTARQIKRIDPMRRTLFFVIIIVFAALFTLVSFHYFGNLTNPTLNRIAMIFLPFIVLLAVHGIFFLANGMKSPNYRFFGALLVFNVLFFLPFASHQNILAHLMLTNEYDRALTYLEKTYPENNLLVISDRPNLYVIQGYGAKNFHFVNDHKAYVKQFLAGYFDEVVFLQRYDTGKGDFTPATNLDTDYQTSELTQLVLSVNEYLVISRLENRPIRILQEITDKNYSKNDES